MKEIIIGLVLLLLTTGCSAKEDLIIENNGAESVEKTEEIQNTDTEQEKVLIAWFSHAGENYNVGYIDEGNTYQVVKELKNQLEGKDIQVDLFEIRTTYAYPEVYRECTEAAKKEQEEKKCPELAEDIDISSYDSIYLGSPVWYGDMPMVVYTFLESHDFQGRTIYPFNTNEGSGEAGFHDKIQRTCPKASIFEVLAIRGSVAHESGDEMKGYVTEWLRKILD